MTGRNPRSGASARRGSNSTSAKTKRSIGYSAEAVGQRIRRLLEEQEVTARIVQLVHNIYGPGALAQAWDEFRSWDSEKAIVTPLEFTAESPLLEHFTSWLAHTWTPAQVPAKQNEPVLPKQVPAQTFLAQHPGLDPLIARYLNACFDTPFSFYEILTSDVGRKFACRDLICGSRYVVLDRAASMVLRAHQILYARIVEVDSVPVIDAPAPWSLPKQAKPAILALREVLLDQAYAGMGPTNTLQQRLLAHESDLRMIYWGFVEQAIKKDRLLSQVSYTHNPLRAAGRLRMPIPRKVAAEKKSENERLLGIPEVRLQVVRIFTDLYENWVYEKLPVFGNRTALEAVATPEGQLRVAAALAQLERDLSLLPFPLDPQIYRRMRERLGIPPTEGLG